MHPRRAGELLLAETAAAAGTTSGRGRALLEALHRIVPFDGAWLALADPVRHRYHFLAGVDLDASGVEFLTSSLPVRAFDAGSAERARSPSGPAEAADPRAWAGHLVPSGLHETLTLPLSTPAGRPVGLLALLSRSREPPAPATRRRLQGLAPVLAHGIDPMRSLITTAQLARGATAGVVLHADGGCQALPGLPTDGLLGPRSPVLAAAGERIGDGKVYSSFHWPVGGAHAPGGHRRVIALASPQDVPPGLLGVALLAPAGDLHGLTPRELQVLGLLVEGFSNQDIARTLVVTPRTVAAHLEHVLSKLEAPTRTLVAVRAARDGLFVAFDNSPSGVERIDLTALNGSSEARRA